MTTAESAETVRKIADLLRVAAFQRRITQGAIAKSAGLSRSAVSEYLNGHTAIPLSAYLDLCAALRINPNDLLDEAQAGLSE